ncbi:hypothetical protein L0128_15585 [candidate division KSB1 bacterium]|nr:hypothetical protein [candidate division KSB1 bacterium]
MKIAYLLSLMLCLLITVVKADFHVKLRVQVEAYYHHGQMEPAVDTERQLWIGAGKMALHTPGSIIVVNLNEHQMIFMNRRDSTFVESPLPLDLFKLVEPQFASQIQAYPTTGTITATPDTQKIKQWACQRLLVNHWIEADGERYNENEMNVWITTDVPFDLVEYQQMLLELYKLNNLTENFFQEYRKVNGFTILSENVRYQQGTPIKMRQEVLEISEKTPPQDVYAVPPGFKAKTHLSRQDLRER